MSSNAHLMHNRVGGYLMYIVKIHSRKAIKNKVVKCKKAALPYLNSSSYVFDKKSVAKMKKQIIQNMNNVSYLIEKELH